MSTPRSHDLLPSGGYSVPVANLILVVVWWSLMSSSHAEPSHVGPQTVSATPFIPSTASSVSLPTSSPAIPASASSSGKKRPELQDSLSLQDLYMVRIRDHSKAEIIAAVKKIEAVTASAIAEGEISPVKLVLSGDEARLFLRKDYGSHRGLINRVATLEALGVLEVKACETWMRSQGIAPTDLMPFVQTVPFGPDEMKRLVEEGYHYL